MRVAFEIAPTRVQASDRALALNEVEILRRLEHPGVVRFDGYFSRGESLCILMQFCDEGDLFGLLSDQRSTGKRLRESQVRWGLRAQGVALCTPIRGGNAASVCAPASLHTEPLRLLCSPRRVRG